MTATLAPIARRTLHDELVDRLRAMIVDCRLTPGSKVNEAALSAEFHVSRTPLREALRSLASEGLVELTPRRGAAIAPVTREALAEAFPILGALEALAGELACARISDGEIAEARRLQDRLAAEHARGDLEGYSRTNAAVHRLILETAANDTLSRLLRGLDGKVRRARYMANMSPERWSAAVAEHAEITAALAARDGARLAAVLRAHISNKFDALCDRLEL